VQAITISPPIYRLSALKGLNHSLKNERAVGNYPIIEKSDMSNFFAFHPPLWRARFRDHCIVKGICTNVIGSLLSGARIKLKIFELA